MDIMSGKSRIGIRLKEAIGTNTPSSRSGDLRSLTDQFNNLKVRLHELVAALRDQHESMVRLNKTRAEVAKQIAAISEKSPIYVYAGQMPPEDEENLEDSAVSYASVHSVISARHEMYTDRYLQFVVNYASEWEKVVVTKITAALKKADNLRVDLDHYQSKVESMQQGIRAAVDKGKPVDPNQSERLRRNEEKLLKARNDYESFASALCVLMEEVTDSCWKDLQPLLTKMLQFDLTINADEAKFLHNINGALDALEEVARKHGMDVNAKEGPGIAKCRGFDEE